MLKEYHYDHLIRWPRGERAAIFLTFDFQGGEDVKPDKNGILNYEMWSQGEYGPHHAIYRVLRILKEENVKATFLTCGAIADRFPEAIQAILDHGHPVEGHGYHHEIARYLKRDEETEVMRKALDQARRGRLHIGIGVTVHLRGAGRDRPERIDQSMKPLDDLAVHDPRRPDLDETARRDVLVRRLQVERDVTAERRGEVTRMQQLQRLKQCECVT